MSTPSIQDLTVEACKEAAKPLRPIYDFVQRYRPETAEETIRARIYEAMEQGKIVRVAKGVYFARSGPAQLLIVEGSAWDVLKQLEDNSIGLLITDPPGRFGREWAGMGTTRPHVELGGRTYQQPEIDAEFLKEAFRVVNKQQQWNTLSADKKARGDFPRGGAACLIRVPIENRTTRPHVQKLIQLAECYDHQTSAYTTDGLKDYTQLKVGDTVLSLDNFGDISEDRVTAMNIFQYKGEMIHFKQRSVDLLVTPNHNMVIRTTAYHDKWKDYITTEKASKTAQRRIFKIPSGKWAGRKTETMIIGGKNYDARLVCYLVGLYIGDGYSKETPLKYVAETGLTRTSYRKLGHSKTNGKFIHLPGSGKRTMRTSNTSQNYFCIPEEDKARGRAEQTLRSLGIDYRAHKGYLAFTSESFLTLFHRFGTSAFDKHIARQFLGLDKDCLQALLDGIIDSDGYIKSTRNQSVITVSRWLATDLIELGTKLGLGVSTREYDHKSHRKASGEMVGRSHSFTVYFRLTERGIECKRNNNPITQTQYEGVVWCPTVEKNHNLLVYRNGKTAFCGNSVGFVYYGEFLVALDKLGMGYDAGRDKGAKWILLHAGPRNGVLWDLSVPNVIQAKRVRNPAKPGFTEHEAEKDPMEYLPLIRATTRAGDIILDPFAGVAKWTKQALSEGRHVILSDVEPMWVDRIAAEDFGFVESN